jgi:L-threonylcarbamoyladenylate synthase
MTSTSFDITKAGQALKDGALVAFPTETVYGLGADATNEKAVASIFETKGRPQFNPLISHISFNDSAINYSNLTDLSQKLIEIFWPGALTLVLPRSDHCPIAHLASAGLDTVALRMPAHPIAQSLIEAAGTPVAAPSANRSGEVSPTTAQHVRDSLGTATPLVIDGGPCEIGLESTVIRVLPEGAQLLRPGSISREEIEAITGPLVEMGAHDQAIASPGQLASHYAPRTPLRLNATSVKPGEALLAFGDPLAGNCAAVLNLSAKENTKEAAANLFSYLRALDKGNYEGIAVMKVSSTGLGEAINDRLTRAATKTTN